MSLLCWASAAGKPNSATVATEAAAASAARARVAASRAFPVMYALSAEEFVGGWEKNPTSGLPCTVERDRNADSDRRNDLRAVGCQAGHQCPRAQHGTRWLDTVTARPAGDGRRRAVLRRDEGSAAAGWRDDRQAVG